MARRPPAPAPTAAAARPAPVRPPTPLTAGAGGAARGRNVPSRRWRHVLIGDAESPHLLKWARALAPEVELWVASSRGFLPGFDGLVPSWRRLALAAEVAHGGGNVGLMRRLPELARWLQKADADWIHPHYLTSHGSLAWAAKVGWRLRGQLVGSAWGSDILVTPRKSAALRWLTGRVLRACALTTSDSEHMAAEMRALGAREVRVFPFGLERMPAPAAAKEPWRCFANRGLEPLYRPERVLEAFAAIAAAQPEARLVVANDGSLRDALHTRAQQPDLAGRVEFVGRLDAAAQDRQYARATWYLSLPASDSVAVSVLEAMAHGCIPILSDLPANHELLPADAVPPRGLILPEGALPSAADLQPLLAQAPAVARANRAWVQAHGQFAPAVHALLQRLGDMMPS